MGLTLVLVGTFLLLALLVVFFNWLFLQLRPSKYLDKLALRDSSFSFTHLENVIEIVQLFEWKVEVSKVLEPSLQDTRADVTVPILVEFVPH